MEAQERQVEFYETADGRQPCREWLDSLRDRQGKAKIRTRIQRVSMGNLGYCEPVGSGVMELKIDFGPGYRVYFGQLGKKLVVLLCGGDKRSQSRDIEEAIEFWEDFKRRYGK